MQNAGHLSEAIASHSKAIDLRPDYASAYFNLGNAFLKQGENEKAIESYVKTLKLNPNHHKALLNAGHIFNDQNEITAAISSFKKAIQINPGLTEAHNSLGAVMNELTKYSKALEYYSNSLALNPNDAVAHAGISSAYHHSGCIDHSIEHAKKISIAPEMSEHYCKLSACQRAKGNLKESRLTLQQALKIDPNNATAYYLLSLQLTNSSDAEKLIQLTEKLEPLHLTQKESISLQFAKANCFHKLKKYKDASSYLAKANASKLLRHPSDLSTWQQRSLQSLNNISCFQDAQPQDGNNRIFIIGVPRCGSTLLESILATNPLLKDLGETSALRDVITHALEHTNNGKKLHLSKQYAKEIGSSCTDKTYTIDKNLYNFVHSRLIASSMPAAKIIHCSRNPLDNILSMLRANLVFGNNYASDPVDAAKMIIMQEKTLNRTKVEYPRHIFSLNYDALVNDPKQVIEPLIEWLGLAWSENYLHPELVKRTILTASVVQARKPISNKSVGGWKNYKTLLEPASRILRDSNLFNDYTFE